MARHTKVELIDDVDGGAAVETLTFAVDGKTWEIDLNADNAQQLRADLEKWQHHARRVKSARGSSSRTVAQRSPEQTAAIRRWARENGYQVSDRGRISAEVERAYQRAN